MAELKGRYNNLPYLDVTDQLTVINGAVNKVKKELRNAVNTNRVDDMGMRELIALLEQTLLHIDRANLSRPKVRKARVKATTLAEG
jgi:hypothetical protein